MADASVDSPITDAASETTDSDAGQVVKFAVIGDFGVDNYNEARVADLVISQNPDFVITTGDNNYPSGLASTIDANIGKYYSQFIGNYVGGYPPGSSTNRFWPSLGNHDWDSGNVNAHANYFTLPGNERYYDVVLGLVHLFAIDSDSHEPDGIGSTSTQATWLRTALAASTSCFDVVFFHHPAYSSGQHGSTTTMRWPFETWGADAVLAGHDHVYERFAIGSIPYFTVGVGGANLYSFTTTLPGSQMQYNADHGALFVTVDRSGMRFELMNATTGAVVDSYTYAKSCP